MQLVVARIGRAHGIRGEVTVEVRTDDPEARFAAGSVLATDPAEAGPLTVRSAHWHSGRLLLSFEGVADRTGAEALRGTLLVVDTADLAPLDDPEEFYDWQLEGLRAELPDGSPLGVVTEVVHLPGGDVLAVRRGGRVGGDGQGQEDQGRDDPDGGDAAELLVPFVAAQVPVVDVAGGRVVLDPAPGLLDL